MGFLTEYRDNTIEYKGRRYELDLSYDTVLNVQRMFRERKLDDGEMLMTALSLFGLSNKETAQLDWSQRSELINAIFEEKLVTKKRPRVGKLQKLFDFEEDGEYIYASFFQCYGIDLIEQRGKLPWDRFIALFQGLSDKTKIREVMRIRGMELPAPNGRNQKEIQELIELKTYYALGYREENSKDGLERLFMTLEGMAG